MKRLSSLLFLLSVATVGSLTAQEPVLGGSETQPSLESPSPAAKASLMDAVAPLYQTVKGYIIAAAEEMPEDKYAYKPVPEVRSYGQIIGHVANAQYMFCNAATGTGAQAPEDFEKRTTKAGLVEAVRMAFAACDAAYAMDDAKAMEEVQFFGQSGSRLWVLNFNVAHAWEHYGNLVTYLRANGLVPPSSQGGGM